ncbi:MAG: AAA family ATPase [Desulfatibacillum sp.]|nr:AAA family ATPase [Desulfatibacillum sp.]
MTNSKPDQMAPQAAPHVEQLGEAMTKPAFYPFPVDRVEVHSTHISLVFVAGDFAYKIKKPLNLGFLDFSTLKKRRQACEDELALNRRLAPDIYLEVAPIYFNSPSGYSLSPQGEPVEYAVKMKRLDDKGMFDVLLEQGKLRPDHMEKLARIMADFHALADTGPRVEAYALPRAIARTWAEDLEQIRQHIPRVLPPEPIDLAEAFAMAFLGDYPELFSQRIADKKIRDCHGDLHLQNICLDKGKIRVFDCIEFNEKFRCMDVASEVAFLAMDLECRDAANLAQVFVEAYIRRTGDQDLEKLLLFYKCYRALVRTKIMCIRANGEPLGDMANQYAWLAAKYAAPFQRPALICMAGITGSGKSGLAREISRLTGAVVYQTDVIRKTMHGLNPTQKVKEGVSKGIYGPKVSEKVYESMLHQATQDLEQSRSVILDATFTKAPYRKKAVDLAGACGAEFFLVVCQLPEKVARERIMARAMDAQAISDGNIQVYEAQKAEWEAPDEIPHDRVIIVETTRPANLLACHVLEVIKS